MLPPEAEWLGRRMAAVDVADLSPMVNVGSSTASFRTRAQPCVHREIFGPLERRGAAVVHVDLQPGPGVDLVGDVMDAAFLEEIRRRRPRAALVSNLLEHVPDPERVAAAVVDMLPLGGYVFASGPRDFPYHPDPIDNRLRPTVEEMAALFPRSRLVYGATLTAPPSWRWPSRDRGNQSPGRTLARLAVPLYKPRNWMKAVWAIPYMVRSARAVAVVLRTEGG